MIPVVTLDKEGKINGYQAFNDNLTPQEEINRLLLATLFGSQQKLTNIRDAYSRKMMNGKYDDAKIAAIKTAALALNTAVDTAIKTFEAAV